MGPLLGSCWIFCFFVPLQVWCFQWFGVFCFFFGACQCFVKSKSPNLQRHQKTQNKQSGSGGHIDRHQKKKTQFFQQLQAHFWIGVGKCGLVFFVPVQVWCIQWFGVFQFFWCLPMFFLNLCHLKIMIRNCVHLPMCVVCVYTCIYTCI